MGSASGPRRFATVEETADFETEFEGRRGFNFRGDSPFWPGLKSESVIFDGKVAFSALNECKKFILQPTFGPRRLFLENQLAKLKNHRNDPS